MVSSPQPVVYRYGLCRGLGLTNGTTSSDPAVASTVILLAETDEALVLGLKSSK